MTEVHDFDPFAKEVAYIRVNEKLIDRLLKRLEGKKVIRLLDVAAGTGLMTAIAFDRAKSAGAKIHSTLLDFDLPALFQAQKEVDRGSCEFVYASADKLPFGERYDAVIFANSIHMLDAKMKADALAESRRVLHPGGVLAINSAFYEGSYPESSKPFYGRWIRRSIVAMNKRRPERDKSDKVNAIDFLDGDGYAEMVEDAGFKIVERRERTVRLSQASVRAISAYKEFAKGALHATDEDAEDAVMALQETVQQAFRDLKMKYLPRHWLELIAVKV